MRLFPYIALAVVALTFSGCSVLPHSWSRFSPWKADPQIPLEEYISRQRGINERYLYGTPGEALKACQEGLDLERSYARDGDKAVNSDQSIMLAYTRLFVLSDRLRQKPEADMYLKGALKYAKRWQPAVGRLPKEKQEAFVRGYLEDFEKGLEIRWKSDLK